jgi:hypothetical protein
MFLESKTEKEQLSTISMLFILSFALLLILGTLSMAFANFTLGFVLFLLGIILLIGNEWLEFRNSKKKPDFSEPPSKFLSSLINFVVAAFLLPSAAALLLFFVYGWGNEVLVVSVAGLSVTAVKLAARTAQLFIK